MVMIMAVVVGIMVMIMRNMMIGGDTDDLDVMMQC